MCRFHYRVDITANVQVLSQRTTRGATDTAERDEGDGLVSGHLQAHINTSTRSLLATRAQLTRACFSLSHESVSLPHFDTTSIIISLCLCGNRISYGSTQIRETRSYHICLNRMKKAFKHLSIMLVRSVEALASFPFR